MMSEVKYARDPHNRGWAGKALTRRAYARAERKQAKQAMVRAQRLPVQAQKTVWWVPRVSRQPGFHLDAQHATRWAFEGVNLARTPKGANLKSTVWPICEICGDRHDPFDFR